MHCFRGSLCPIPMFLSCQSAWVCVACWIFSVLGHAVFSWTCDINNAHWGIPWLLWRTCLLSYTMWLMHICTGVYNVPGWCRAEGYVHMCDIFWHETDHSSHWKTSCRYPESKTRPLILTMPLSSHLSCFYRHCFDDQVVLCSCWFHKKSRWGGLSHQLACKTKFLPLWILCTGNKAAKSSENTLTWVTSRCIKAVSWHT